MNRAVAVAAVAIGLSQAIVGHAAAQTGEQTDRLVVLGQVWGFLKYFHPGIANGRINWDSVLVATVPNARTARSNADLNAVIRGLLDAAGRLTVDSPSTSDDLTWLTASKGLDADVAHRLVQVRDNRHRGSGRYVTYRWVNSLASGAPHAADFSADTAFASMRFPPEPVRLLGLFRYWNAVRYYYPYVFSDDVDWNRVLAEFVPRVIAAKDQREYHLAILAMSTRLRDAFSTTTSTLIIDLVCKRPPPFRSRVMEGKVVVTTLPAPAIEDVSGLRIGDVITHADGKLLSERRREFAKYVAANNTVSLEQGASIRALCGTTDSIAYGIERDGKSIVLRVGAAPVGRARRSPVLAPFEVAKVLPGNLGYVDVGGVEQSQIDAVVAIVKPTKGLVLDLRNGTRATTDDFAFFLNRDERPVWNTTSIDSTYPGRLVWGQSAMMGGKMGILGNSNPDYYRGRVAILIDERSTRYAQSAAMALSTAPQHRVIGSPTPGAIGRESTVSMPGGVQTTFTTMNGWYYPDGRAIHRTGVVPDIEIRPTIAGIRAGRDEVLERALEYLRTGR